MWRTSDRIHGRMAVVVPVQIEHAIQVPFARPDTWRTRLVCKQRGDGDLLFLRRCMGDYVGNPVVDSYAIRRPAAHESGSERESNLTPRNSSWSAVTLRWQSGQDLAYEQSDCRSSADPRSRDHPPDKRQCSCDPRRFRSPPIERLTQHKIARQSATWMLETRIASAIDIITLPCRTTGRFPS